MKISAAVVTAAAALWFFVFGLPPSWTLPASALEQYECLARADSFSGPAVGIAGVEPEESKALRALAVHPHGGRAFKYLLLTGSPAGKIYALIGLRHTNPMFFRAVVQPFRLWPGDVKTQFGCIGATEPFHEIVSSSRENPVRLKRGETLADWWRRRKPGAEMNLDIIGGGYTSMFIHYTEFVRPTM